MLSETLSLTDPTVAVAERQLAFLGELGEMAMVVCRATAAASVAASHAVEELLANEYWQPETGRARALAGAKDAADSFQKASRSLRLTLTLEKTVAEWLRDERLGIHHPAKDASEVAGVPADRARSVSRSAGAPADSSLPEIATDAAFARPDVERPEFDRPDTLLRAPFRDTVERICADLGAPVDWNSWKVGSPDLDYKGLQPKPPGWSAFRPPAAREIQGLPPLEGEVEPTPVKPVRPAGAAPPPPSPVSHTTPSPWPRNSPSSG